MDLNEAMSYLHDVLADVRDLQARFTRFENALRSIAANMCCDRCHEAALVAQRALDDDTQRMLENSE